VRQTSAALNGFKTTVRENPHNVRILLALSAALLLLSVGSGATASSTPPPRNGLIAVNGPEGIYIVDPRAGTTKLLPGTAELTDPAWSPDGTLLAVTSLAEETGNGLAVYTMKSDGSEKKLVLANAYSPSWSPDGKQLVVVREEGVDDTALAVVDIDGGHVRPIDLGQSPDSVFVSMPEWSPDGKLIAYVDVEQTIRFATPEGEQVSMPAVEGAVTGLSWSPDSTSLAFDRYVETKKGWHYAAVVLDLATGREAVYAGEQLGAKSPTWSPEGNRLAYLSVSDRPPSTSTTTTTHSCGGDSSVSRLWVMSRDGTKAHKLVEGEYYGTPSWGRASEAASVAR
jgi:Tol biopolymer transport system component